MKRIAIAVLLATPLLTAPQVRVQQVAEMLTSGHASRTSDDEIARRIGGVELAERLTETTLATLSRGQGERTKYALQVLADQSAFLDPPAAELPAEGPPAMEQQKAILARARDYAGAYMRNLPNFTCTEIVRRLDDERASRKDGAIAERLRLRDTIVSGLVFHRGVESHQVRTVNGKSRSTEQPMDGITTRGEFGAIVGSLFAAGIPAAEWSHWEIVAGERVAVFNYSVDSARSDFSLSWCWSDGRERQCKVLQKVPHRGALFIEPVSGAIFRVARQALQLRLDFPMRKVDTVVEYRVVRIGGKPWLCPVRSVTISDTVATGPRVNSLNQVEFTDYHKFEAESKLTVESAPDPAEK